MTNKIYIYALCDPRTHEVRYVGKSNNPEYRFRKHIYENNSGLKSKWIKELKLLNLKPILQIIDIASETDWKTKEQYWVGMFPNLLNINPGGEYIPIPPQESYLFGEKCSWSKLNDSQVSKIIELYKYTNLSEMDLSKLFHINRKTVNRVLNGIDWKNVTNGEKTISLFDKRTYNKFSQSRGSKNPKSKLKENDVIQIRIMLINKQRIVDIASKYNISASVISNIKANKIWKHVN